MKPDISITLNKEIINQKTLKELYMGTRRFLGVEQKKIYRQLKPSCKFCGSNELVYHQYIICDSKCQDCGEWQNQNQINNLGKY